MLYLTRNVGETLKIEGLELTLFSVDHTNSEAVVEFTYPELEGEFHNTLPVGGDPLILLNGDLELHLESLSYGRENAKFGIHGTRGRLNIDTL